MTCDTCQRKFGYSYYINAEYWFRAKGKREGHLCAHCLLGKLGGVDWYIVLNEPVRNMRVGEPMPAPEELRMNPDEITRDLARKIADKIWSPSWTPRDIFEQVIYEVLRGERMHK